MEKSNYTFYLLLCGILCLARATFKELYCVDDENRCKLNQYDGYTYELESYQSKNNVTMLKLKECNISPEIFRQLPNLQVLDITNYFMLSNIGPDTFKFASNLIELSLTDNSLKSLNVSMFEGANNLKYIDLSNNRINMIHNDTFKGLSKLTKIDLSYNKLTNESVQVIGNLHNLEELTFRGNDLKSLTFLKNLTSLTFLDLSYNPFHLIPSTDAEVFKSLVNLKHLVLKKVGLSEVLDVYANYIFTSGLELLDISHNNLEMIDIRYLMKLDNLRQLNISRNPFSQTPAFQGAISLVFPNLRILGNAEFFDGIWQCTDIAMLFKAAKKRGIEILPYFKTSNEIIFQDYFEGIKCFGKLGNLRAQIDQKNQKFDELWSITNGIRIYSEGSLNQQYYEKDTYIGISVMTIIILSIIVILFLLSIANTIIIIYFGRKYICMGKIRQNPEIIDERTKLIR